MDAGAEATGEDVASAEPIDQGSGEQEWWEDPGMPWRHKPTRQDIACLAWIGFLGVFSMAMLPLRAWLLGAPERLPWLVALMGSRTGAAGLGSLVRVGAETPFIWPLLVGTLMSIKLDWTYWWAGKLWGRGMIEIWAGQSERAARNYGRMERWADKLGWLGIFIAYVPIPLPIMAVVFVLAGAQGMSWKKFMVLDFFAALIWLIGYFFFGYAVGEPAVALLEAYAKVANYVAIGLVVFVVVASFWRSGKAARVARVAG
ncbi:MAG: VTT domain-containing protein [Brooklawnia sp.]